jgi:hypothetical protein
MKYEIEFEANTKNKIRAVIEANNEEEMKDKLWSFEYDVIDENYGEPEVNEDSIKILKITKEEKQIKLKED